MYPPPFPMLAEPGGPASLIELIGKRSAANQLNLDISWGREYELIVASASNIAPITADTELELQTSSDGSTFDGGGSDYHQRLNAFSSSVLSDVSTGSTTLAVLGHSSAGLGLAGNGILTLLIPRPYDSAVETEISGFGGHRTATNFVTGKVVGKRATNGAVKGLRFAMASGNIDTMELVLWGLLRR